MYPSLNSSFGCPQRDGTLSLVMDQRTHTQVSTAQALFAQELEGRGSVMTFRLVQVNAVQYPSTSMGVWLPRAAGCSGSRGPGGSASGSAAPQQKQSKGRYVFTTFQTSKGSH